MTLFIDIELRRLGVRVRAVAALLRVFSLRVLALVSPSFQVSFLIARGQPCASEGKLVVVAAAAAAAVVVVRRRPFFGISNSKRKAVTFVGPGHGRVVGCRISPPSSRAYAPARSLKPLPRAPTPPPRITPGPVFELELELIPSHMAQKPVLRGEVGCACVAREVSVERGGMGERGCARRLFVASGGVITAANWQYAGPTAGRSSGLGVGTLFQLQIQHPEFWAVLDQSSPKYSIKYQDEIKAQPISLIS